MARFGTGSCPEGQLPRAARCRLATVAAVAGLVAAACGGGDPVARRPSTSAAGGPPSTTSPPADGGGSIGVPACGDEAGPAAAGSAVRGDLVVERQADPRSPGETVTRRLGFVTSGCGDVRIDAAGIVNAYDARAGTSRSLVTFSDGAPRGTETTGMAPGLPDATPAGHDVLSHAAAALVVAKAAEAEETTYEGRPAWRLAIDVTLSAKAPPTVGDHLDIVVDRASGLALSLRETRNGTLVEERRLQHLEEFGPVTEGQFAPAFPDAAVVDRSDQGFRRVGWEELGATVDYEPLRPGWLPEGTRLLHLAVAREAPPTGPDGTNPASQDVVAVTYGEGPHRVVVTTRRAGDQPSRWADPFGGVPGYPGAEADEITIDGGYFHGATAKVVVGPHSVPYAWAVADGLVVTAAGTLGREALLRLLASLDPPRPEGA